MTVSALIINAGCTYTCFSSTTLTLNDQLDQIVFEIYQMF